MVAHTVHAFESGGKIDSDNEEQVLADTLQTTDTENTEALRRRLATLNQRLEANNSALEEAQALTHLGSWQWNVASGEISWSDELYRIYGLKPQERQIDFESFMGLIHSEDRDRVGSIIGQAYQTGAAFEFEHRITLSNNSVRILYGKGKADKDAKGAITRMVGTSQDVTEQRQAEAALRLSDERFQAVSAATNDVVYDREVATEMVWSNDALSSQYGYPAHCQNQPLSWWIKHIHPADQTTFTKTVQNILNGTKTHWTVEYRFKKHDGTYVDVRDRAFILRDDTGRPLRIIGSMLDITQQKELERAKDKFISLVSHQLRTPLTAMRLFTGMLAGGQGGKLSAMQSDFVDKINASTVRMIRLVSDILNVSQIERGRLKVVPVPTDISSLIGWHIDELKPVAEAKKVAINYEPIKDLQEVNVDPVLFGQIVHNFLTNAIRYSRDEDTTITVRFERRSEQYVLAVQDSGIGIPKNVQRRIFSSFFRADNAVKAHGDGTGLGLYLIKLIMDAAGGETGFESIEGKGSTFYVTMPFSGMKAADGDKILMQETHGED